MVMILKKVKEEKKKKRKNERMITKRIKRLKTKEIIIIIMIKINRSLYSEESGKLEQSCGHSVPPTNADVKISPEEYNNNNNNQSIKG